MGIGKSLPIQTKAGVIPTHLTHPPHLLIPRTNDEMETRPCSNTDRLQRDAALLRTPRRTPLHTTLAAGSGKVASNDPPFPDRAHRRLYDLPVVQARPFCPSA